MDVSNLTAGELAQILNATRIGTVCTDQWIRTQRIRAGLSIGNGKRISLLRYVAWAATQWRPVVATEEKPVGDEREREAARKKKQRAASRDLMIPPIADPARRKACEEDIYLFLKTYFPDTFYEDFTPQRRQIVDAILTAAKHGGDQSIAAPRGDGKTTIAECVLIFCMMTGLLLFPLIAAATGPDAERILSNIKEQLEEKAEILAADFPEVCHPIRALGGMPNRANGQTVGGKRTLIRWSGKLIRFPRVPGSAGSGAILMTRGMDAAIRGIRVGYMRPDFVLIDDPETRDSASNDEQVIKREQIIEQDLGGLGGSGKRLARVMLTTVMNRRCLSWKYTDPQQKPSWKGRRFRLLEKLPERQDLWDEFISRRKAEQLSGDENARGAHAYYLENREKMEAGAVLGNPYNFIRNLLPDGSAQESSSLEHCYVLIADRGWEHFATEYLNDPLEESGPIESGISATRIQMQVSGVPRRIVPSEEVKLVQAIDVGKFALHWVVSAWKSNATGWIVDYGVQEVWGTTKGSDEAVDTGIRRALHARREVMLQNPYCYANGDVAPVALTLVDAGYRTQAIYAFCREVGIAFRPAMGFGQSSGAVKTNFNMPMPTKDKRPGDQWFLSRNAKGVWLVCMAADHWKAWVHDRFMTPPGDAGSLRLFGMPSDRGDRMSEDQKGHFSYAKHLTNEIEVEEPVKGKGMKRGWKVKSETNHYFDATYMSAVAASMCGVSIIAGKTPPRKVVTAKPNESKVIYL
jgi:hypothetical protein